MASDVTHVEVNGHAIGIGRPPTAGDAKKVLAVAPNVALTEIHRHRLGFVEE